MNYLLYSTIIISLGHIAFMPVIQDVIEDATGSAHSTSGFFIKVIGVGLPAIGTFVKFIAAAGASYSTGSNIGFYTAALVYTALWIQIGIQNQQRLTTSDL